MIRRVPFLRRDHQLEGRLHLIDDRYDFFGPTHRPRASGKKVVLQSNQ